MSDEPPPLSTLEIQDNVVNSMQLVSEMTHVSRRWSTVLELSQGLAKADGADRALLIKETPRAVASDMADDRPPSPLRPGVYVGLGGRQFIPVFPGSSLSVRPMLMGAPGSEGGAELGDVSKTAAKLKTRASTSVNVQRLLELRPGDDPTAEEMSQKYNQWRRKVIESARVLQLEANRFQPALQ